MTWKQHLPENRRTTATLADVCVSGQIRAGRLLLDGSIGFIQRGYVQKAHAVRVKRKCRTDWSS